MAIPIKETPILHGKAAERFEKSIKANENKKVSASEFNRAIKNYRKIMKCKCNEKYHIDHTEFGLPLGFLYRCENCNAMWK